MRILDSTAIEKILRAVADPENIKIMTRIRNESKSAQVLSVETEIPQSTVYRKLDELKDAGLAMTDHFVVNSGKKVEFVIITFSELRMTIDQGKVGIEIIPSDRIAGLRWLSLFRGG